MLAKNRLFLGLAFMVVLVLQLTNLGNTFFWDTTQLASDHATFFYNTNFSGWLLPDEIDSGHIPAFGFYLALLWKIFGRTLVVSHLAIVPFALLAVWQLYRLCLKFIPKPYAGLAVLLVVLDPTVLGQFTLVSPDVPLIAFFLLAFNAVLENKKYGLTVGVLLLFLTSMRGMMAVVCLLLLDVYCNVSFKERAKIFGQLVQRSFIYIPAAVLFIAFNTHHFLQKGWIGYHKDSPWADCFAPVDFKGFLFNIAIYGWRLLDFGRIGIWLVFGLLLLRYRKNIFASERTRLLLFFALALMIFLPANMLWAKNLLAHRYLIPIYVTFALLAASVLFAGYVPPKIRNTLTIIWLAVLVSGNFWIYPDKIAKGWDSTPAHLPYYKLRHEAMAYLDARHIDYQDVQSFFPNTSSMDILDLNGDPRHFGNYDGTAEYVFYSNIYNLEDAQYDQLFAAYRTVKAFRNNGVLVCILKKAHTR